MFIMKKIVLILLLLFFSLPAFAQYKPISKGLSQQYKQEMEQIINEEYPYVIRNIDDIVKDARRLKNRILKHSFNQEDYINLALIPETCIPSADLDLYGKLLQITTEKYLGIEYKPIGTDSVNPINDILSPYFRDNNVNRDKLNKIIRYENKKIKVVEKYIKQIEKYRPLPKERLYNILGKYDNIHDIKIKNKTYTCHNNNCYDFDSLYYNKLTKVYKVDMIMDLMWCNAHQEYKSPYHDGYISYLIFETKLLDNKVTVKCKGFVVGDVVVDYKNGKAASAHYSINSVYKGIPKTISNIKEFNNDFLTIIDVDLILKLLKTW